MEYRWVPGHKDVTGNKLADQLAKKAATLHSPPTTNDIIATASLANISRDITLAKRADRDACRGQGPEGSRFAVLSTEAEQGTDGPLPPMDGPPDGRQMLVVQLQLHPKPRPSFQILQEVEEGAESPLEGSEGGNEGRWAKAMANSDDHCAAGRR